ncbi:MAG TPA: chromosomal replication initiator protein DnaA [Rhodospirillaceae bacterium]|jgi:chromosomal replication initiator protein|nr:chromosomal replication initiator protein DnaA [Alphaproteobacteria bacterium]HBH26192.1 chromosomal replication initiator protein DnaA [Rhodospirillaceae bacterium]
MSDAPTPHADSPIAIAGDSGGEEAFAPPPRIAALWGRLYGDMRTAFGDGVFRSWLRPLTLRAFYHGTLEVSVPTRFMRDWIQTHYAAQIEAMARAADAEIKGLQIVVVPTGPLVAEEEASHALAGAQASAKANENRRAEIAAIASPLDARFTFGSFVVGKPNALAHAAARRVVESAGVPFNPLFLYGGVGLGKTHLLHAIAHALEAQAPDKVVMYLSAERFMYQFVRALRAGDAMAFKEALRSVDVLLLDDIQFIAGKESTQEEFFHSFNALVDHNKQIIISADRAPGDLQGLDERLRSRLAWGLVADLQPTTYDLRLGILRAKRAQLGQEGGVPDAVLEYLATKITSNIRELEGALNRLVAHAEVTKTDVTLETTAEVLGDLLRSNDRRVTIDEIQRKVAEHYALRLPDMHSARRARAVARPRQIAMYLAKQLTPRSLPEIGRKFGGRDHTTVMHAVRKIEELMEADAQIAQDVDLLRRALAG